MKIRLRRRRKNWSGSRRPEAELEPVRIEAEEEWSVDTPAIDWPDELPSVKREGSSLAEKEQKMVGEVADDAS